MPNFRPLRAMDSLPNGPAAPHFGMEMADSSASGRFRTGLVAKTAVAYYLTLQEHAALRHSRPKNLAPSRLNPFRSLTYTRSHDPVGHPNAALGGRSTPWRASAAGRRRPQAPVRSDRAGHGRHHQDQDADQASEPLPRSFVE